MTNDKAVEKPAPIIPVLTNDFINVLVLGGLVGLLVWGVGAMLDRFVFDAYFCQGDISSQCMSAQNYSAAAALLVGAIAALAGLIRLRVYRPLLVVIASFMSLWGLAQLSWTFDWMTGVAIMILLHALGFGLYSWIARIREFWIALFVVVVLVVAVRLVFVS